MSLKFKTKLTKMFAFHAGTKCKFSLCQLNFIPDEALQVSVIKFAYQKILAFSQAFDIN